MEAAGLIEAHGAFRCRTGAAADVPRRIARTRCAEQVWPWARRASAVLAHLPFVRAVLVTGGMSKNSTTADGDVDFMLLVEPGRVWTLKSMLQAARRVLPAGPRELFCTNYLLAADRLLIDDQNLFTAVELATAVPMAGPELCVELIDANPWVQRHIPGISWSRERAEHAPRLPASAAGAALERAWSGGVGPAAERAALRAWDRYWNHKYRWLDRQLRSQRFKRREHISTNHLHDFQGYVLDAVAERFAEVGLPRGDVGLAPPGTVPERPVVADPL